MIKLLRRIKSVAALLPSWVWIGLVLMSYQGITALLPLIETSPIYYPNLPFPTESPVHVGDPMVIHARRCSSDEEPLDFTYARVLHNVDGGKDYSLSDGKGVALYGCIDTVNTATTIPLDAIPGRYRLIGVVRTQGRFGEHKVIYQTTGFDVIP